MEINSASYRIIADLLRARTGQQLTEGRSWRIGTALAGLFRKRGITNMDQLVCLLASPGEAHLAQEVVEALLNNETYFFRDRQMYDALQNEILPELAELRKASRKLRIWSAGCSTGQEALSLAMMFKDRPAQWDNWQIEIVATDISSRAISIARRGTYSQFEIQRGLSVAQMLEHFEENANGWTAADHLLSVVHYQQHNLFDAPPRSAVPYDIVLCRNVLLYFDRNSRSAVFDAIHGTLAPDGWLMLGAGETTLGQTNSFTGSPLNSCLHRPAKDPSAPLAAPALRRARG